MTLFLLYICGGKIFDMKKLYFLLAFIALFVSCNLRAQEIPGFVILGKPYGSDETIELERGKITLDYDNLTLYLDNVHFENKEWKENFISWGGIGKGKKLKIVLVGENVVKIDSRVFMWEGGDLEICGSGSLTAHSFSYVTFHKWLANNGDIIIRDCKLDLAGYVNSINAATIGECKDCLFTGLIIDNATVKAKGHIGYDYYSSMVGLKSYKLINCAIQTPNVTFGHVNGGSSFQIVSSEDGEIYPYPEEVLIAPSPNKVSIPATLQGNVVVYGLDGKKRMEMERGVNLYKDKNGRVRKCVKA